MRHTHSPPHFQSQEQHRCWQREEHHDLPAPRNSRGLRNPIPLAVRHPEFQRRHDPKIMGSFPFKYQINEEKLGRRRNHTQNSGKHRNPVCERFQCFRKTFNSTNIELHTLKSSLSGPTQRRPSTEHLCFPAILSNNILERTENI